MNFMYCPSFFNITIYKTDIVNHLCCRIICDNINVYDLVFMWFAFKNMNLYLVRLCHLLQILADTSVQC